MARANWILRIGISNPVMYVGPSVLEATSLKSHARKWHYKKEAKAVGDAFAKFTCRPEAAHVCIVERE